MADIGAAIIPHLPQLRAYACALTRRIDDAEDLLQDTVCRALEKAHQFQPGTDLKRWLTVIMRNHWRDQCRDREVERRNNWVIAEARGHDYNGGQEDHVMLAELPRRMSSVLWLAAVGAAIGMTDVEVSARQGVPRPTARSRVLRARLAMAAL